MNWLKESWNLVIMLFALLLLTSGCVKQSSTENFSSTIPSVYTAPIGGFEKTWDEAHPNDTLKQEYIFYSRNWGPGEVRFTVGASYINGSGSHFSYPLDTDLTQLHIEPASFIAEPNHTYKSQVYLNTNSLPKEFFEPLIRQGGGWIYPVSLNVNVTLEDHSANFGQDSILLYPIVRTSAFAWDTLTIENCSVTIKRGETRKLNITYQLASDEQPQEVTYISSQTPVNVTITPSRFIAKRFLEFPSVVTITADPSLVPGVYPIGFAINGSGAELRSLCNDTNPFGQEISLMNVSVV
jgi:hypothetical protein